MEVSFFFIPLSQFQLINFNLSISTYIVYWHLRLLELSIDSLQSSLVLRAFADGYS